MAAPAETANAEGQPAAPAPPKPQGPSKILPILVALNLAATGAGLYLQLRPKPQLGPDGKIVEPAKPAEPPGPGPTATLDPFVVNLNETGSSRYLKATFELELKDAKAMEALEKDKRGVRDEVLRYLSGLSVADTLGADNKDKIRAEIIARVDRELGGGKVKKVFLSDFVVQ